MLLGDNQQINNIYIYGDTVIQGDIIDIFWLNIVDITFKMSARSVGLTKPEMTSTIPRGPGTRFLDDFPPYPNLEVKINDAVPHRNEEIYINILYITIYRSTLSMFSPTKQYRCKRYTKDSLSNYLQLIPEMKHSNYPEYQGLVSSD